MNEMTDAREGKVGRVGGDIIRHGLQISHGCLVISIGMREVFWG